MYNRFPKSLKLWASVGKKEERRENDSFSIRLMDIYYKRRTECKDAKGLKRNVYICPSSNSLFSGPLGLPSPQLWLILRLAFLSHRTGGRTSMGRAWRTKRNFVSRLTNKRNEGNIMYRFKQKIITIKSDKSIQDIYIKIKRINPKFIFDVIPDFHNFREKIVE